jgi:hypothetical protein
MNELILKLQAELNKGGAFKPARVPRFRYTELAAALQSNPDTPVDTGELKSSYSATVKGDTIEIKYASEYAARVYYDPEIQHHTGAGRWFENEWTVNTVAECLRREMEGNS